MSSKNPATPPKTRLRRKVISSVVVIGASAGGMDALSRLVAQLPGDFPAPILIVHHMPAESVGSALMHALQQPGKLPCTQALDGERIVAGHIYLAPPDNHLMISGGRILITKGAMENRARPAIDPLFRSAAVAYGNRVIGVLLTGYLDDGTAGLMAIKRCGGVCVAQDPADAAYPDMPQNALNQLKVDHCVPLDEMGSLLASLVVRKHGKSKPVPEDIDIEAKIAERVLSDLPSVNALGKQAPFNCPGCGGVLWQVGKGKQLRYRCHTGHAYTASILLAEQNAKIEETLWVALRMFEERRNLLVNMESAGTASRSSSERVEQSKIHIDRIRNMLRSGTTGTSQEDPKS
jgi:two-component system chemotaxis response regulator CheB